MKYSKRVRKALGIKTKKKKKKTEQSKKYHAYVNSPEWAKVRRVTFELRGRKCEACGNKKRLHLHHNNYMRVGSELDGDLNILCSSCHSEFHRIYGTNIKKEWTLSFIDTMKGSFGVQDSPNRIYL